jgi:hypothetical protein
MAGSVSVESFRHADYLPPATFLHHAGRTNH